MLHIVDQTRSSCPNNKVSCKEIMTNANVDLYFDDGIEVRVVQLPHYSANEAGIYFDSAPPGYAIASGNIDDSCLAYPEASEGMINIGIACATFKSTNQRVCALSEDLATEGSSLSFKFMSLIKADSSGETKTQARGAKSKRVKSNGKRRLLQEEEENIDDLVVTFPQDWVWDTNEELFYPMILSSAAIWTVDACLLLPPGHELVAAMNANSTEPLPLAGECTHTVVGDYYELVLLFEVIDEESPWGDRALSKNKHSIARNEIKGHIEAKEKGGSHFKKPAKKIDFSTAARTRHSNNVKKVNGKS